MALPFPHRKQRDFMRSAKRFMLLLWGRRSGKSMGIAMFTMLKAIEKQGNYYIIAPTYKQAKSIYWQDILKVMVPNAIIKKTDEGELYIQFEPVEYHLQTKHILGYDIDARHDPELPPSTIYLKGADNPDSLRGVSLDGAVMDESAFYKDAAYVWNNIIRPALADREGWGVWTSTPNGTTDEFYRKTLHAQKSMKEDGDWYYSHATAMDNPYFPENEWELTKKEYYGTGREDQWMQEWEAKFVNPSKLIYKEFDDEVHIINDPLLIPRTGTFAMAMDFGYVDPFACVFVVIDENDNWYVYDEIYQPGLTIDQIAAQLKMKMGDNYFTRIIGDAAGATEIHSLRKERIWVRPSKKGKDTIKAGIRLVAEQLHIRENGRPKLYISAKCVNFIDEMKKYSRLVDAWGETSETPEDRNNHLMDAIRYLFLDKDASGSPIPKAQPIYDTTGRRID